MSVVIADAFPNADHIDGSLNCFYEKGKLSVREEQCTISFDEILSPGKITYVSFPDKELTEDRDSFLMALYDFKKKEKDTQCINICNRMNGGKTHV